MKELSNLSFGEHLEAAKSKRLIELEVLAQYVHEMARDNKWNDEKLQETIKWAVARVKLKVAS